MSMEEHLGVFKPFTKRMGREMKLTIIRSLMTSEDGIHHSPSGMTARLVIEHCMQEGYAFSVDWDPKMG